MNTPDCAALPVVEGRVISQYGMRRAGMHYGVDIGAREGTPVFAVLPGRVRFVADTGQLELYGNTVVIKHGAYLSLYAHLQSVFVHPGQDVEAGELIGTVGRTSGTRAEPERLFTRDAAHLHLEFLEQWPIQQGGGGRLDPGPIFAELGIMAPEQGPLQSLCGGSSAPGRSEGGIVGAAIVGLALYAAHRAHWI